MPLSAIADSREQARALYESAPMPTWRRSGFWTTSLRDLKLDELAPHQHEAVAGRGDLPVVVAETLGLGQDEAPQFAGIVVQRGGSVIYTELDPAAAAQGVILCTLEEAFEQHFELASKYYGKRIGHDEGKFSAANAALWTGGAFFYVPPDTAVEFPIQTVYLIDEPGEAQYARTLGIIDRGSKAYVREYYLAPDFNGQSLHAGALELFVEESANGRLATFQDWGSSEVYDISTKRVQIGRDAHCSWFPIHLNGVLTKQTLDIITAEIGSDMKHVGVYFTDGDQHLDLFTTDLHEKGKTTGDTVWKGAAAGRSRASYEGLIEIVHGAQETHTYLQTHSMMLSPKAKIDAIPSLIVKTDDVSASHGGTVGEIDEDQIFYMRSRGISREDAIRTLIEGFFDPAISEYEDPQLEQLVRDRIGAKLHGAADEIIAYAAAR